MPPPSNEHVTDPSDVGPPRLRPTAKVFRWVRRFGGLLSVLVLLGVGLCVFLTQSARGQAAVLHAAVDRLQARLAGRLDIEGIRSGALLSGATLAGVTLVAGDERRFLTADSVVLEYSLSGLLFGDSPFRSAVIHGLDVEISRYQQDQPLNLRLLLAASPPSSDSVAGPTPQPLRLGHVAIRNGSVAVLSPASTDGGRARIVRGPNGERLRRIGFDGLSLDVEDVVIDPSSEVQFEAELTSLTAQVSLIERPLVVREAFGTATFGPSGIRLRNGAVRLGDSLLRGDLTLGPDRPGAPWSFRSEFVTDAWAALEDLQWIDGRIPDGRYRGAAGIVAGREGVVIDADQVRVELEASEVVLDGRARFRDLMTLSEMHVAVNPLALHRLEPWLGRSLPLDGWLSGDATFTGTLDDLDARGHLTLVPTGYGGRTTSVDFYGGLVRGDGAGARDFRAVLEPLDYGVLAAFWPQLPWGGVGEGTLRVDGAVADGITIEASFGHRLNEAVPSRVDARGTLRRSVEDGTWSSDLDVDLAPLSVGVLARLVPQLGLTGSVSGPVAVEGPFSALRVRADLVSGGGGGLRVDGALDARDPASFYRLNAEADSLVLSTIVSALPAPTSWTGSLALEGSGLTGERVETVARLRAEGSRIGPVRVDTGVVAMRLTEGMLIADSLDARVGGLTVTGGGRLGLVEGRRGTAEIDFDGESLLGLRPLLMGVGDTVLVRDGLTELDQEFLRLQGVDPDTLPSALDVRVEGRVEGAASLSGRLGDLDVRLLLDVVNARYRDNQLDTLRVTASATRLPAVRGSWEIGARARGVVWDGRTFASADFEADMLERTGRASLEVERRPGERYRAAGTFAFDSIGGQIDLSDAALQVDDQQYLLAHDTRVRWDSAGVVVDSLEVNRAGPDPMYMLVDGALARGGRSDFRLVLQGLHVEQIVHLLQADDVALAGHLDMDVRVRGAAEAPAIDGTFLILGARWGAVALTRVQGALDYDARRATFDVEGWDRTHSVVRSSGVVPIDLSLTGPERRLVDEPMTVHVVMDSLDAAIPLSYASALESVVGVVTGDVTIRGTPRAPEPEGAITLRDAAWSVEAIGVRHSGVNGVITLRPDRTAAVELRAEGSGRSDVTGLITLAPFEDPALDLAFDFRRFPLVARPDIDGLVSGGFRLGGTYRRPVATGALTVDVGTIYVDELQRAAGVVDLNASFLFAQDLAVDTVALVSRPLFEGLSNPFFDNLRVDIDLAVPRGSWLRSIDTNAELSGELIVRYDRSANDFVLIGELQALRGSHRVLGRSFELDGGRVLFIGRPGLNPDLDIQASTRVRRPDDTPFQVQAQVSGTLVQPLVTLTTEETGLAEEDLVSYLVFGQPSSALGGRSAAQLGRLQGGGALSPLAQGAVTFVGGAWANQFGTAFAQELGALSLDYVSVQQGGGQSLGGNLLGDAQLELGRYIGDDLFVVMVIRPFDTSAQTQNTVAGVRVEVALTDDYNLEMFFEDRFLRSTSSLLGTSPGLVNDERVLGLFLFREWGYRLGGGSPPEP
jgi:hypothetical protein